MMFNTDRIAKLRFKLLVVGILITIIYDLIWFFMNHFEYSEEPKADASGEINVRRFSLMMSYASFILRVRLIHQLNNIIQFFVALIFWKDSLDFEKIIQNKEEIQVKKPKAESKLPEGKTKGIFLRNQLNR